MKTNRKKHLFFIHGRGFKPNKKDLAANWSRAIEGGLGRDGHTGSLAAYKEATRTFVYYGDISNQFLQKEGYIYDKQNDVKDRADCLEFLKEYSKKDFLGEQGKKNYKSLNGASTCKKFIVGGIAEIAERLGVAVLLTRIFLRDVGHYWNPDAEFGSDVRWRLTDPLAEALCQKDDILLIAHSLGSMISYDVLWKFSRYGEYQELRDAKPNPVTLVTLGSPLGNETVKNNLKGGKARGIRRYPTLINTWENFSAVGDYISHDEEIKDDYEIMVSKKMVSTIRDHKIYNLATRHGASNPHHGVGYLIHPRFISVIAKWLIQN